MLSILRDPDTTRLLLEFILDTPTGRRSVSRIARTCKALSEPALTVLWKELDSLNPLLSTMPSHLFKRARRPGMGFAKMPEDDHWKRLLVYGQRVRKLAYNESAGNVSPSIFSIIEDYRPQDFIVPNLTALTWRAETPEGLERSLLFLTPEIQCLSVEIGSRIPQEEQEEFLTEVATLTGLAVLSISSSTRLPEDMPSIFRDQGSLQKVAFSAPGALSPSIGRWLSSMSTLRSLQMDVSGRSDAAISEFFNQSLKSGISSPKDVRTPDSGVFSADEEVESSSWGRRIAEKRDVLDLTSLGGFEELRHLNLTGEASSVATFLGRMTMPLQHLELVLEDPEDESEWRALCSTIHRQFRDSLRSLQIIASGSSRFSDLVRSTARGETSSRRLALDSLASLPQLLRLEVDLPESIIVYDADMVHLASACPNLEILKLCPVSRWPVAYGPPKLTLAGLVPLTTACRRLHTLAVAVHAVEPSDDGVYGVDMSSRSLLRLHVGHSWVGDPLHVAILLSHLSPHLEVLKWFHEKNRPGYVEANNLGWQKVSENLPSLQRLRLRERSQAQTAPAPATKLVSTVDMGVDATQRVSTESRGVLARPSTASCGVEARPTVAHKSTHVERNVFSQAVDATPGTRNQGVDAMPPVIYQSVDAQTLMESRSADAASTSHVESIGAMAAMNVEEPDGVDGSPGTILGAVGDTFRSFYLVVRAVSPPILLRIFDMWSMFTLDSAKVYSDDMIAAMRSPMLFSSKNSGQ